MNAKYQKRLKEKKMKGRRIILAVMIVLTVVTMLMRLIFTNTPATKCALNGGVWNEETKECNYAKGK